MKPSIHSVSIFVICIFLVHAMTCTCNAQPNPFGDAPALAPQEQTKKDEKETNDKGDDDTLTDTSSLRGEAPQIDDNFIRFHMWDGSIIGGVVQSPSLPVDTDFGPLVIPISRLLKFHPGLESLPDFKASVEKLVAGLGDRDFDTREKSHRTLAKMGPQIRKLLDEYSGKGSAERKKRLGEIKAEIDEIIEEYEDDEESPGERALMAGDLIETPDFSVVGKIKREQFVVASRFGQLNVRLSDIKMADRSFTHKAEELRKTVKVGAEKFFQRGPTSTKIRVNPGDRIKITATGIVNWTNWSTSSSPNGLTNQGQYLGIHCGTLCARIGKSNDLIKIGSDGEFVAKKKRDPLPRHRHGRTTTRTQTVGTNGQVNTKPRSA